MKGKKEDSQNICMMFGCSKCCKPVKINSLCIVSKKLPFIDNYKIFIPKEHPDTVRLKTYRCKNFNPQTGLCDDYKNRPQIYRNTKCKAFEATSVAEQARIIEKIKTSEFFHVPTNRMEKKNV